jgi:hypothetical protein
MVIFPSSSNKENGRGTIFLGWLIILIILFGAMGAFYSDWILGAIAGKWSGMPSGDNEWLYWSYFAAKRLPMFSV